MAQALKAVQVVQLKALIFEKFNGYSSLESRKSFHEKVSYHRLSVIQMSPNHAPLLRSTHIKVPQR